MEVYEGYIRIHHHQFFKLGDNFLMFEYIAKPDFSREIPDFSPKFLFGLKFRDQGFGFWVLGCFIRV
jgi:hypothetical protein